MTSHYVTFAILGGLFITAVFFNVSAAVNNEAGQVDQEGETDLESSLPFCPPSLEDEAARNNNVLIVSTLDGKITALDPSRGEITISTYLNIDPLGRPHMSVRPSHCRSCVGWPRGSLTTPVLFVFYFIRVTF